MSSPFGGKGGGSSSGSSNTSNLNALQNLYSQYGQAIGNIGSTEAGYGLTPLAGGQAQYTAGLTGQMTPAQQALSQYTLGQNQLNTANTYSNLGLGGSTMQAQDQNANALQSLAQQEAIDFRNEAYGLNAMQTGSGMLQQAAQDYGLAGQNLYNQAAPKLGGSGQTGKGSLASLLGGSSAGGAGASAGNSGALSTLFSQLGLGNTAAGTTTPGGIDASTLFSSGGNFSPGTSAGTPGMSDVFNTGLVS